MKKMVHRTMSALLAIFMLASIVLVPADVNAASAFYGGYTDVSKIYDYGSCPSMQGLAVGSQKLYTIKINSANTKAFISMTDKDSGSTTKLYNSDAGSYYFSDLGHANDMDVWGIDGYSNLFITSTNEGSNAIVRLKRSGNNLTKVASYSLTYNGAATCATALSIKSVSNGVITFITKLGMNLYTGSVSTSATSANIELTKLCTISKSKVYIKGSYLDLSSFVNQGMGYHNGMLYVPISGDDSWLNRSVIMVFNLNGVIQGSTIYPSEAVVFRVTSGTYSALFEIESCDISSGDGKLYFNTNRRKTDSNTNHDGVSAFDDYTFVKLTEPAHYHSYTVQYDANGGTGSMEDTVVPYGVGTALRTNTYTREGYEFVGWTAYRTANAQWYYTNGSTSSWYAEGSQPSGYTKHVYADGIKVAKTSGVDGDVVIMYAQWEKKEEPFTATGTVGAYLDRVTSASELVEGVPYIISDYKDSWLHYVLTAEYAERVSGSKTHKGYLLDGEPSVDTPYLWYIKDGYLVYGSADSDQYLLISYDSSSQGIVELGSFDTTNAAYVVPYSGDDFAVRGSRYLNRRGGTATDFVATAYSSAGGSYWHFDRLVEAQNVTLTVKPSLEEISTGSTTVLTPVVKLEGAAADAYTLSWSSSDNSVASVASDGTVTGLNAGQVTITAILSAVDGHSLTTPISVKIPLTVSMSTVSASAVEDSALVKVGTLQTGVPYVITEKNTGAALTGTMLYSTSTGYKGLNGIQGLKTVSSFNLDSAPVWYYDGTHLRYGTSTGTSNYLVYNSSNQVALGSLSTTNIFDKVTVYSTSNKTFNIYSSNKAASASSYYLNQMGGANYNVAGLFSSAYYSQWHFSQLFPQQTIGLSVAPGNVTLSAGDSTSLGAVVTVDGTETDNYTLTWSSSNRNVAVVSSGGVITASNSGKAVITATLTAAGGRNLSNPVSVEIVVQVTDAGIEGYNAMAVQAAKLVKVTSLQTGVPYVVIEKNTGVALTGSMIYTTDAGYHGLSNTEGLKLVDNFDIANAPVWYYDGTHLLYGTAAGSDNYLVCNSSGQVALGSVSEANIFDTIKLYSTSNKTFTLHASGKSSGSTNYYLNQLGGASYNAAGLYQYSSTSQWHFSVPVPEKTVSLNVTPDLAELSVAQVAELTATVTVNGTAVTDYELTWTTSDASVATVNDGTVTAVGSGDVILTVTLTGAEGDTFSEPVSIQIPLTVAS